MWTIKDYSFHFKLTILNTGFWWIFSYTATEWKKKKNKPTFYMSLSWTL